MNVGYDDGRAEGKSKHTRAMLISRSQLHPVIIATPAGGSKIVTYSPTPTLASPLSPSPHSLYSRE